MKNIILTGTYNSMNKGDAAMELSAAKALGEACPHSNIVIHSPFPEIDAPFYDPIPVVQCSRRRLIWGTLLVLRCLLWQLFKAPFLVSGNTELASYFNADIVVDLSGDMQTDSYGPHVAYSHIIPIALSLAAQKPVILCAQSIGPFKWTTALAKLIFSKVNMITVRDNISIQYLSSMKIHTPVIHTADIAFLLEPSPVEHIDRIFDKELKLNGFSRLMGVSISGLIAAHFKKYNIQSKEIDFYQFMAIELDTVIEKLNIDCVFVAHVTGPSEIKDDRKAADRVKNHMKHSNRAHVMQGDYRPEELKGIISRFWVHTGARMHASIAAVTTGVPVASISYSHKTPGVMAQFGLKKYVLDISTWTYGELYQKINSLIRNRTKINSELSKRTVQLKEQSKLNIKLILSVLETKKGDRD